MTVATLATALTESADPHRWVTRECQSAEQRAIQAAKAMDFDLLMEVKTGAEGVVMRAVREGYPQDVRLRAAMTIRRIERLIAQAVRAGQDAGQIRTHGQSKSALPGPSEVLGMPRSSVSQFYDMAVGTDAEFNRALAKAFERGNLARVVVAEILGGTAQRDDDWIPDPSDRTNEGAVRRRVLIKEMAAEGRSSKQISDAIGTSDVRVRELAREMGIEIPADTVVLRLKQRAPSGRIAAETVTTLEALVTSVGLIDYDDLDPAQAQNWASSLNHSLAALTQFAKQIKKVTQ